MKFFAMVLLTAAVLLSVTCSAAEQNVTQNITTEDLALFFGIRAFDLELPQDEPFNTIFFWRQKGEKGKPEMLGRTTWYAGGNPKKVRLLIRCWNHKLERHTMISDENGHQIMSGHSEMELPEEKRKNFQFQYKSDEKRGIPLLKQKEIFFRYSFGPVHSHRAGAATLAENETGFFFTLTNEAQPQEVIEITPK